MDRASDVKTGLSTQYESSSGNAEMGERHTEGEEKWIMRHILW